MIRLALALMLLPAFATAETCHFGAHGTNATILPGAETFAEIVLRNRLAAHEIETCNLEIFGVTFAVHYDASPGSDPDTVSVTVPPGFAAEPPEAVIADGDQFTFLIHYGSAPGW